MTFENDTTIKWIYAQRIDGGAWVCKRLTGSASIPKSIVKSDMFESTPIGEMQRSEFAIFRNRPNWMDYQPRERITP